MKDHLDYSALTPEVLWLLRTRFEAALLRGCRRVAFVPDNLVARRLASEAFEVSHQVRSHFVPGELIGTQREQINTGEVVCGDVDALVICVDDRKVEVLSWLNSLSWQKLPEIIVAGLDHQQRTLACAKHIEHAAPIPSHAVGYDLVKAHIYDALHYLRRKYCHGAIVELGVFRGGTLLMIEEMLRDMEYTGPTLVGFDTFSGFPPRKCLLDLFSMDRFRDSDYDGIRRRLESRGIQVIRGDISETASRLEEMDLLLTFFDTDNYTPVASALPICFDRTVPGGIIIFDHYYTREEFWETIGERVAAEEFFQERNDVFHLSGTGVFIKVPFQEVESAAGAVAVGPEKR